MSSLVVEMDLLFSRRLRLSNSCPSSPVLARWPALGRRGEHLCVCGMCVVYVWLIYAGGVGVVASRGCPGVHPSGLAEQVQDKQGIRAS